MNKVFNTLALPTALAGASFLALAITEVSKEKAIGTAILCALGTLFIQWKFSGSENTAQAEPTQTSVQIPEQQPEAGHRHVTLVIPDHLEEPVTVVIPPALPQSNATGFQPRAERFRTYATQPRQTDLQLGAGRQQKTFKPAQANTASEQTPRIGTARLPIAVEIDTREDLASGILINTDDNAPLSLEQDTDAGSADSLASSNDSQDEMNEIPSWNRRSPSKKERTQDQIQISEARDMSWLEAASNPSHSENKDPIVSKEEWDRAQPALCTFYQTAPDTIKKSVASLSQHKLIQFVNFWNHLTQPEVSPKFKNSLIEKPDMLKQFLENGLSSNMFANRQWLVKHMIA